MSGKGADHFLTPINGHSTTNYHIQLSNQLLLTTQSKGIHVINGNQLNHIKQVE